MAEAIKPSSESLVGRARDIAPALAAYSTESARLRQLHPECMRLMQQAGLFRATQPRRIGGDELPLSTMYAIARALAEHCGASGWVYMVLAAHTWILGMFPEAVQDEIAADDPQTIVSGTLAPQGLAEPVEGGFRLSGRWQFCSGVDHARWSLIGALQSTALEGPRKQIHVMMPATDYQVDDTWHVMGLQGTGSRDLVLDKVFVPNERLMPSGTLFGGRGEAARRQATALYLMPVMPGLANGIASIAVGIARDALNLFIEATRVRPDVYSGGAKAQRASIQSRLAEAEAEWGAAELMWADTCARFDALAASGTMADIPTRARLKLQAAYTTRLCRRAVERVFAAAGAHAVFDTAPLQARFRDLTVASHHAAIDFDEISETFGRVALGLPPESPLL